MPAFTHYWSNDTCQRAIESGDEGKPLTHLGGNRFTRQGVAKGDRIYVVTVIKGHLFLVGRMIVATIVHSDAEARALLDYEPWSADDHLIAQKDGGTPQTFRRKVASETARMLRFETSDGPQALRFKTPLMLDKQTLRGVRKLSPASVALLDALITA